MRNRDEKLVLPGGIAVTEPSRSEQWLEAIARNQNALYQGLMGLQAQLDILIRLECGADKRSAWKMKLLEMDLLNNAAREASFTEPEEESSNVTGLHSVGTSDNEVPPAGEQVVDAPDR